jgi:hypothetical protein
VESPHRRTRRPPHPLAPDDVDAGDSAADETDDRPGRTVVVIDIG